MLAALYNAVGDTTDKRSRLLVGDYVVLEDFASWDLCITHMIRHVWPAWARKAEATKSKVRSARDAFLDIYGPLLATRFHTLRSVVCWHICSAFNCVDS